jgi:hypothetical protein
MAGGSFQRFQSKSDRAEGSNIEFYHVSTAKTPISKLILRAFQSRNNGLLSNAGNNKKHMF